VIERARDGDASVQLLMDDGRRVLRRDQLMEGVPEMLDQVP
jgi:urease gamma subunit